MDIGTILKKMYALVDEEVESCVGKHIKDKLTKMEDEMATMHEMIIQISLGADVEVEPVLVKEDKKQMSIMKGAEIPEAVLKLRLGEIVYNINAVRILSSQGLTQVRDVMGRTNDDLLKIRNFGVTKLFSVRDAIDKALKDYNDGGPTDLLQD